MNLNLHHESDQVHLEMARTTGYVPAKRVEDLVKVRLLEFGLKMENIVIATTAQQMELV